MGDNLRDIRRTFALLLEPGSVAELRAPLGERKGADAGYFDDFDKLAQAADAMSGNYPAVYVTLNPCDPALLARAYNRVKKWATNLTADGQIVRRRNLLIDVDATRPGGISSTDAEHAQALARVRQIATDLTGRGWPAPLYADSGNGGHLVYRIALAADDTRVQRVLKALASEYDDDAIKIDTSVYSPAHLAKVYGTLACKGDNTPTRPHRWARILEAPDTLEPVSTELIDALLADLEPTPAEAKAASVTVARGETFDLASWMQRYAPDATGPEPWQGGGRVWTFAVCPWRPDDTGATAYVAERANGAIKAACHHNTCPGSKATGNHWKELRALREPGYVDRAGGGAGELAGSGGHERYTDAGNARRLVARHGQDLAYCEPLGGWLCWDGRRWALDDTNEAERRAKETIGAMFAEAAALDGDARQAAVKHALASESARAIRAMVELAKSEPGIAQRPDAFDCDPWALNVANGTLDLRTGQLRPHDRADMITKLAPVTFDPDAKHPTLARYIADVTSGDADFAAYLQRAAGYSLTGSTAEEAFFLVLGPAATGKSTLIEALLALLGDYSVKSAFDAFLESNNVGGATPELARLRGARLVAASETSKSRKLNESLVKELTGGDSITARNLYAAPFTFKPCFKLWLGCNEAPKLTDTDSGLWRRLQRLPFERELAEGKRDPKVKQALTGEALPALLAWAVRGCLDWQRGGLRMAPTVRAKTAELRADFDPLAEFFSEACVFTKYAETPAQELRDAYAVFAASMGVPPIGNTDWSERLRAKGCKTWRTMRGDKRVTLWQGIGLKTESEPDPEPPETPPPAKQAETEAALPRLPQQTPISEKFSQGAELEKFMKNGIRSGSPGRAPVTPEQDAADVRRQAGLFFSGGGDNGRNRHT